MYKAYFNEFIANYTVSCKDIKYLAGYVADYICRIDKRQKDLGSIYNDIITCMTEDNIYTYE